MGEVLRALEGPIAPMICATDDPEHATICDRSARCTVNVLWVRVRDAIAGRPRLDDPRRPRPARRVRRRRRPSDRTHPAGSLSPTVTDDATDQHLVIRGLRVAPVADPSTRSSRGST